MKLALPWIFVLTSMSIVLAFGSFLSAGTVDKPKQQTKKAERKLTKVNLDLDEETAAQIAEIILVKVFGERVLKQKPWKISKEGSIFKIEGSRLGIEVPKGLSAKGGVALIQIDERNAEVVEIIHGR